MIQRRTTRAPTAPASDKRYVQLFAWFVIEQGQLVRLASGQEALEAELAEREGRR